MQPIRNFGRNLRRRFERPVQRPAGHGQAGPGSPAGAPPGPPRVEYSYVIHWTKQVRGWDAARRATIQTSLSATIDQPGFEPNAYLRRYRVPGLDDQAHAGASLVALGNILAAFRDDESRSTNDG
jgi:hypothetical protein